MLFSFKQFQQTKEALIKQFQQQPPIDYQSQQYTHHSSTIIHEYNKLLNQIKFAKYKNKSERHEIKNSTQLRRRCHDSKLRMAPKSATFRKRYDEDYSLGPKQNKIENKNLLNQESNPLYITQCHLDAQVKQYQNTCQPEQLQLFLKSRQAFTQENKNKILNRTFVQTEGGCQEINDGICETAQQVINLRVKIFEGLDQQKYLHNQIQQLQQSIKYYKRLNNDLQLKIDQKQKKHIIVLNSMLQKQSQLNSVDCRNKFFKQKFQSTQKFFAKSLKSIKISRNSQSKKCHQLIEDTTQKILTMKFYKQKIQKQKQLIYKLQSKHKYKQNKLTQNKNMYFYAQLLIKLGKISSFIKSHSYGQSQQLQRSIDVQQQIIKKKQRFTHKNQTSIFGIENNREYELSRQKNTKDHENTQSKIHQISRNSLINKSIMMESLKNQSLLDHRYDQLDFLHLTKQILKIYFKLIKDQERLKQNYQYKLNQMENNRKYLYFIINQSSFQNQNMQHDKSKERFKSKYNNNEQINSNLTVNISKSDEWMNRRKIIDLSIYNKQFNQQIKKFQYINNTKLKKQRNQTVRSKKIDKHNTKLKIEPELQSTIKNIEQRIKKQHEKILSIQQRIKFFIRRQLKCLQKIIRKWLKFDHSAINFFFEALNKFISRQPKRKQLISAYDIKQILKQYFQNWQKYLFFVQEISNNPILIQNMNKNTLKRQLRRVIKTKCFNPHIATQDIFIKCFKQLNKNTVFKKQQNIKNLLRLELDIFVYANKFQVLIVNISKHDDDQRSSMEGQCDYQNKIQQNGICAGHKTQTDEIAVNKQVKNNPFLKILATLLPQNRMQIKNDTQKVQVKNKQHKRRLMNLKDVQSQSSSSQMEEDQMIQVNDKIIKQKEQQQNTALLTYIMAYQSQINKIKDSKYIGRQKFR